ncbi:MAG TPA: hypothetical protein DCP28_03230, partial [Cytophagales bacterium]|nr:hypothetical protein [Cytophagales bacterium]
MYHNITIERNEIILILKKRFMQNAGIITLFLSLFFLSGTSLLAQTGPGGVGSSTASADSISLWLRADTLVTLNGSNNVTSWADLSGNGHTFTSTSTFTVNGTGLNSRPTVDFAETSGTGVLQGPNTANFFGLNASDPTEIADIILVFEQRASNSGYVVQFPRTNSNSSFFTLLTNGGNGQPADGNQADDMQMFVRDVNDTDFNAWVVLSSEGPATNNFTSGQFHTIRYGFDPDVDSVWMFDLDDLIDSQSDATIDISYEANGDGPARLGSSGANQDYDGEIAEMIVFNDKLSDAAYIVIQNYISARYGLTTANDFYTETSGADDFSEDVVGIGSDGTSSHMANTGAGGGLYISGTTGTGTTVFDGNEWLFAGHNGLDATGTSSDVAEVTRSRLNRIWKLQKTETDGFDITLTFDLTELGLSNVSDFALYKRTATSGNFTNLSLTPTVIGDQVSFTVPNANLTTGDQFFTLAFGASLPGGVSTNLALWLQADNGVEVTGSAVDDWRDQSGNSNDATDPSALAELSSTATNFNPGVAFNADATSLEGAVTTTNNNLTFFAVYEDNSGANSAGALFEFNSGAQSHSLTDQTYAGGGSFSANITKSAPALITVDHPSGTTANLTIDGAAFESSYTTVGTSAAGTYNYTLGDDDNGGNTFNGVINELIAYEGTLSATEKEQVDSYLAVKYGITLAHDYLASDGTLIFDVDNSTVNDGYESDIVSLGNDLTSGLDQKVAKADSDSLIVALEADFSTSNAGRATSLTDDSFFFVASNGTGYTATFDGTRTKLDRVWKVRETGTVGTVHLGMPQTISTLSTLDSLFVSTDPTFATGVTRVAVSESGGFQTASYDFTDGEYFTFSVNEALSTSNENLMVWLKADAGVTTSGSTVTTWADQSSYGNNADNDDSEFDAEIGAETEGAVTLLDNSVNFNPAISMNEDRRPLTGSFTSTTNGFAFFIVSINEDNSSTDDARFDIAQVGGAGGADDRAFFFEYAYATTSPTFTTNTPDDTLHIYSIDHPFGTTADIYENGSAFELGWTTNADNDNDAGNYLYVIGDDATSDQMFTGRVAEYLVFQDDISDADRETIESYLAIKYGITIGHDYLSPSAATVFDIETTVNDGFEQNVAIIAREDAFGLDQKVSQASFGSLVVSMAQDFTNANSSRTTTFSNSQYVAVSSNGGSTGADSTYRGVANARIGRKWKVNETGSPGAVYVAIPESLAAGLNVFLVSTDSAFTEPTEIPLSVENGFYYVNYDFSDGDYFSFATSESPAGVPNGLQLWLKADAGVTETSNNVSAWADQSGNGNDATTPATDPVLDADGINYNPSIDFSNTGTRAQGTLTTGTDSLTVFIVAVDESGAASGNVLLELDDAVTPLAFTDGSYATGAFTSDIQKDTAQLLSFTQDETTANIFQNGNSFESGLTVSTSKSASYSYAVGENVDGGNGLTGKVSEVIVYDEALSAPNREAVQSYLAVKYAMPVQHNLVASDGNTVWDATVSVGYLQGLMGLGNDSRSLLNQQIGKSPYDSLYIATSDDFTTANPSRSAPFSDLQYLVMTNDGGTLALDTDYRGTTNARLGRVWRVQEYNNPGIIYLALPNSGVFTTIQSILVSTDPTFSSSVSEQSVSVSGGYLVVALDLTDGQYISFSTLTPSTEIWYSYATGNWSDPTNWTLDGSTNPLFLNADSQIPGEGDTVVINSGRTMTADFNGIKIARLEITGTLDLASTTSHDFSFFDGSGTLRLAGVNSAENYPSGTDTLFYDATEGGTVELYGSGFELNQTRRVNNLVVNLDNTTDEVFLTGDSLYVFGNLTVSQGIFQFGDNSNAGNKVAQVDGNLTVESTGFIEVGATSSRHELNLSGNFTNQGTVEFTNRSAQITGSEATDGIVDFNLVSSTQDQTLDLQNLTTFYRIEINKGVDATYKATLSADNNGDFRLLGPINYTHAADAQLDPAADENLNAIGLYYGTLEVGNNIDVGFLNNDGNYNISEGAKLIVNGGDAAKTGGSAIVIYGELEISAGTLTADITSGLTIRNDGTVTVNGGTVTTRQIRTSVLGSENVGGYIQTGGIVNVTGGSVQDDYYIFNLTYPGNVFQMSGGTLNISGANHVTTGTP